MVLKNIVTHTTDTINTLADSSLIDTSDTLTETPDHPATTQRTQINHELLKRALIFTLEENKAEHTISIDLKNKSDIADYMIITSGRSGRHVNAIADKILECLKISGITPISVEGTKESQWILVDAGSIIIHIFQPEIRAYYNLEKMWGEPALPTP